MESAAPTILRSGIWTVHEYASVNSTNLVAAGLPSWSAVRAQTQSAGRGRFQRSWVSDEGGLWLSAVVPIQPAIVRIVPLLAGLAVCDVVRPLGAEGVRMRWPNDVMIGKRKLSGVLIDQFRAGLAVIGLGINVENEPARSDPSLRQSATRLADHWRQPLAIRDLMLRVLDRIHVLTEVLNGGDAPRLLAHVNQLWSKGRRVELDLDGDVRTGRFSGVDQAGRLLLLDDRGVTSAFDPEQVRHLTESPEFYASNISPHDSRRGCQAH